MEKYELYHHGILGQKWGVRRFQNEDGSLTDAGKRRYNSLSNAGKRKYDRFERKMDRKIQRSENEDEKIRLARSANLLKKQNKYDRKIEKAKDKNNQAAVGRLNEKKDRYTKAFTESSDYIEKGSKLYNDILKSYKDVKLSKLVKDDSYSKEEAKKIIRAYRNQRTYELLNHTPSPLASGRALTKWQYTNNIYRSDRKQQRREAKQSNS